MCLTSCSTCSSLLLEIAGFLQSNGNLMLKALLKKKKYLWATTSSVMPLVSHHMERLNLASVF